MSDLLEPQTTSPLEEPAGKRVRVRRRRREARRGKQCLDCGAEMETAYCPHCGQENIDANTSVLEIFREAGEEFFHLDSKLARTLVPLMFRPGKLTREWTAGRRTRYISPLKLYLTVAAIFFLALPMISRLEDQATGKKPAPTKKVAPSPEKKVEEPNDMSPVSVEESTEGLPAVLKYPIDQLNKLNQLSEESEAEREEHIKEFGDQFLDHTPTAIFLMLPMFAGVLWFLYIRNGRYYVEHLVFALHCHAFYFVLLTLMVVIPGSWFFGLAPVVAFFAAPIYSIVALKVNYGQGWIKTLIKAAMLGFAYSILFTIAMIGCVIVAASALPDRAEIDKLSGPAAKKEAKAPVTPSESNPPVRRPAKPDQK